MPKCPRDLLLFFVFYISFIYYWIIFYIKNIYIIWLTFSYCGSWGFFFNKLGTSISYWFSGFEAHTIALMSRPSHRQMQSFSHLYCQILTAVIEVTGCSVSTVTNSGFVSYSHCTCSHNWQLENVTKRIKSRFWMDGEKVHLQ